MATTDDPAVAQTTSTRRRRARLLYAAAALLAAALALAGPIPLPPGYHAFADQRALFGIPNAADVLTNAPLLLAGLWGWLRLHGGTAPSSATPAWRVFFAAVGLTAFGSAWYHLAPDDLRLAVDRLPIAIASVAFICAFLAERVDHRWAERRVLLTSALLAAATVLYAYASPRWFGAGGDLRPYLLIQLWPLLLLPFALAAFPRRAGGLPNFAWLWPLMLYALAKMFELADAQILAASGFISGHSLKHLTAAAAAFVPACAIGVRRDADAFKSASRAARET